MVQLHKCFEASYVLQLFRVSKSSEFKVRNSSLGQKFAARAGQELETRKFQHTVATLDIHSQEL